jgi:hypothetical protein
VTSLTGPRERSGSTCKGGRGHEVRTPKCVSNSGKLVAAILSAPASFGPRSSFASGSASARARVRLCRASSLLWLGRTLLRRSILASGHGALLFIGGPRMDRLRLR